MKALHHNSMWELVQLLHAKKMVSCKWVYTVKFNPDGFVEWLKARLLAKGYTQTYGINYDETFLQLPKSLPSVFLFLWLLILIGPYFNWISKMHFYIRIYMRKFIWNNHLGLLLRGSIRVVSIS